ncbi:hypothetical protein UlMin_008713 [Ulmus minor]
MAEETVAIVMNDESDVYSYSKNSNFQRKAIEAGKELISKAISEKLDINIFSSSNTFKVADLGCHIGPNTFLAVQNIIDAVETKCQTLQKTSKLPEFQVFFNDQVSNDFNHLFRSLPPERQYFASGVPGSFHGRLFPSASLHFVYSSYSVQALSRIPKEVTDKSSPAFNRGKIHYSNSTVEVIKSFEAQYAKDLDSFLNARAQEIVHGGLMAFVIPGRPNGTSHSEVFVLKGVELLGSSLMDLAKKGIINEEKVDSFNMPVFIPSSHEVEAAVKRNGCFNIEIIENLPQERPSRKTLSTTMRAGLGGMIKEHFGGEILDELYDLLYKKFEESYSSVFESGNAISLFVLLKRD